MKITWVVRAVLAVVILTLVYMTGLTQGSKLPPDHYLTKLFGANYATNHEALSTKVNYGKGPECYLQRTGVWHTAYDGDDKHRVEVLFIEGPDGTPLEKVVYGQSSIPIRHVTFDPDGTTLRQTSNRNGTWTSEVVNTKTKWYDRFRVDPDKRK